MSKNESRVITSIADQNVGNTDVFKKEYEHVSDAGVGVIVVVTREAVRAAQTIQEIAIANGYEYQTWTSLRGWQTYPTISPDDSENTDIDVTNPTNSDETTIEVTSALRALSSKRREGIYVMHDIHKFWENYMVQANIKEQYHAGLEQPLRLILIVPPHAVIPTDIENDLYVIDFLPPSHKELTMIYNDFMESAQEETRVDFSDDEIAYIAQNAIGMGYIEFETALALALVQYREKILNKELIEPDDIIKFILQQKTQTLKKTNILELMPKARMEEVGGYDTLKEWVRKRKACYTDEAQAFGIQPPKGILIVGPPGTGKSLVAKSVAYELGLPCIKFDIGKTFQMYVGSSEERMRSALKQAEHLSPCVLLVDEVDKAFSGVGGGGGDSGTSSRVFGTFLTWMQERAHGIFVAMTANNVIGLPPELMRRGRLDEIFAMTFPSNQERLEILKIHIAKRGHEISDDLLRDLIRPTQNFVGAELEAIIVNGLIEDFNAGHTELTLESLIEAASKIIPISRAFRDKVLAMHTWAKNNALPASSSLDFDAEVEKLKSTGETAPRSKIVSRRRIKKQPTT